MSNSVYNGEFFNSTQPNHDYKNMMETCPPNAEQQGMMDYNPACLPSYMGPTQNYFYGYPTTQPSPGTRQNHAAVSEINTDDKKAFDELGDILDTIQNHEGKRDFKQRMNAYAKDLGRKGPMLLWQFLIYQLAENKCVRWVDGSESEFHISDDKELEKKWGQWKNKGNISFDSISRSLRYYYSKDIMKKVQGKKRNYKFNVQKVSTLIKQMGLDVEENAFPQSTVNCLPKMKRKSKAVKHETSDNDYVYPCKAERESAAQCSQSVYPVYINAITQQYSYMNYYDETYETSNTYCSNSPYGYSTHPECHTSQYQGQLQLQDM